MWAELGVCPRLNLVHIRMRVLSEIKISHSKSPFETVKPVTTSRYGCDTESWIIEDYKTRSYLLIYENEFIFKQFKNKSDVKLDCQIPMWIVNVWLSEKLIADYSSCLGELKREKIISIKIFQDTGFNN